MSETPNSYRQEVDPARVMRAIEFYTFRGPISPGEGQALTETFKQKGPDAAREEMSAKLRIYCDAQDKANGKTQLKN